MEINNNFKADPKLKLLDQVRQVLRYHHYAYRTERTYCECVRLRVKDIDFERNVIYIRAAKGGKDRTTLLPVSLKPDLQDQVEKVKHSHDTDIRTGYGEVYMPLKVTFRLTSHHTYN